MLLHSGLRKICHKVRAVYVTKKLNQRVTEKVESACVVANIIETKPSKDRASFFFCRFDDQETLKARTIVGSIAKQLASNLPVDAFDDIANEDPDPSVITLFLLAHLSQTQRHYVAIDGLDDCEPSEAQEVTRFLRRLVDSHLKIKIFCSSRPMSLLSTFRPQQHIDLDTDENKQHLTQDINHVIQVMLEDLLDGDSPKLVISDPRLVLEIRDRLQAKAQGMWALFTLHKSFCADIDRFLWVKLQLQTLCEKTCDAEIRAALDDLPRDLPETFERILGKFTKPNEINLGRQIFRWVSVAKRPLTIEELQDAIATVPLQKSWDADRLVNDMIKAMLCCGNLIYVDEEQKTVHFTHGSVKQHLTSKAVSQSLQPYHIDLEEANAESGAVCITYLHFPPATQVVRRVEFSPHLNHIPQTVFNNSLPYVTTANKLGIKLLQPSIKSRNSTSRLLQETSGDTEDRRRKFALKQQCFRSYAESFWLAHTGRIIDPVASTELWTLWQSLTKRAHWTRGSSNLPWTSEDWEKWKPSGMIWIVEQNHRSLAQLVVRLEKMEEEPSTTSATPLLIIGAASRGHSELLKISLKLKYIHQTILDYALHLATVAGCWVCMKQLLAANANPNRLLEAKEPQAMIEPCELDTIVSVDDFNKLLGTCQAMIDGTPLQAAAGNGNFDIVNKLLCNGADVNALPALHGGRTALQAAAAGGHLLVIERLLHEKVDVNADAAYTDGRTALQAAVENNHCPVTETLLQHGGTRINAPAGHVNGRTALQAAAGKGNMDLMARLLEGALGSCADINAPPGHVGGRTALQAAAGNGDVAIVRMLLELGAEVNAQVSRPNGGATALEAAAGNGHLAVVQLLLQAKDPAEVNAFDYYSDRRTALQRAAGRGHYHVVKTLLEHGAEINVSASRTGGRTALQAAAEGGHAPVVQSLLLKGAHVNAPPAFSKGRTALQAAVEGGLTDIVDMLLKNGADISAAAADTDGKTARQAALDSGHPNILDMLERNVLTQTESAQKGTNDMIDALNEASPVT